MKRVSYISAFTEPIDQLLLNQRGLVPLPTLEEAYVDCRIGKSTLDDALFEASSNWCDENHFTPFKACLKKDQTSRRSLHIIQSVVGDDENTTSNSHAFGPLIITTGPIISRIVLSKKDTGISQEIGNYAEGWILTPPNAEASFEAVNRRHTREGIPFVLDGVKLKLVSPVRKQSQLELDLESKMQKVSETAAWVNRNWFTYDYHQMLIILGVNSFNFRNARSFPYLFATEGGCGGLPPYGNLDTAISAIHSFHKGKAKHTIYGLAHEAVECHYGRQKPNETFFLRSSHIAQMGDKAWAKYDSVYRSLVEGADAIEGKNQLNVLAGKENLPDNLLHLGVEISPDDVLIGTALSHLRQDKFIMTELDVKMFLENQKKIQGLTGDVSFTEILSEIEKEKELFKSNSWKVLGRIAEALEDTDYRTIGALRSILTRDDYESRREVLSDYYTLRTEKFTTFTSFAYTDAIRVFKTSDVKDYVRRTGNVLRVDIAQQIDDRLRVSFPDDIPAERARKERIFEWINSEDLKELLLQPLPPGIGPDDSRIIKSILNRLDQAGPDNNMPVVIIILTSDRALVRALATHLRRAYSQQTWQLYVISATQYIGLCLNDINNSVDFVPNPPEHHRIALWNYITESTMYLPDEVIQEILDGNRILAPRSLSSRILIEYDYPNLERALEPTRYDADTGNVNLQTGGYLKVPTITNMPTTRSWASLPLARLRRWEDFSIGRVVRYPLKKLPDKRDHKFVNRPLGPDAFGNVNQWILETS